MKRSCAVVLVVLGLGTAAAGAQETYSFTAFVSGGAAGAFDVEESSDFGQEALQAGFGMYTDSRTLVVVRAGRLAIADGLAGSGLVDAELDYANVAGEYRFRQPAYDFGIFLGLGSYRLAANGANGNRRQNELGAVLGFNGDFDLTRRLSFVAEVDLHYVPFEETRLYGAALVGIAVHF